MSVRRFKEEAIYISGMLSALIQFEVSFPATSISLDEKSVSKS